jgi:hypothetical protein
MLLAYHKNKVIKHEFAETYFNNIFYKKENKFRILILFTSLPVVKECKNCGEIPTEKCCTA